MVKPNVFIGSSVEGLKFAYAIQENLERDVHSIVWSQGVFKLSGTTLIDLEKKAGEVDFAVFVCSPDDDLVKRDAPKSAVRDNVIFELGLFIGKIGRERVFFVLPRDLGEIHFPTDLLGITPGNFDSSNPNGETAALGPFCNKVRERVKSLGLRPKMQPSGEKPVETPENRISLEEGVWRTSDGEFEISIAPTVFFSNRFSSAFPGVRGNRWFTDQQEILKRLKILFKEPFVFQKGDNHGVDWQPIWWFRGHSAMHIDQVKSLKDDRILIGSDEMNIERMMVYYAKHYYRHFIYIEAKPEEPTKFIPNLESYIKEMLSYKPYASEWFAISGDRLITLEEYEDGAAEIDGEVVELQDADRRQKFLTTYNFIIVPKYSPFNNRSTENEMHDLLNDILMGNNNPESLIDLVESLERNPFDD